MSKKDIYRAVNEIIQNLTDSEFESIRNNYEFFAFKNPQLIEEFSGEFERVRDSKKWSAFLREIRFWSEVGVEQMNKRLLQLCLRYAPKGKEFFRFDNEIGSFTLPTRIDKLNKLSLLAKELVFDIFPRIEGHMNFKTEMESENLKIIRGKIDWNSTILQSVNRGEKFPLSFTCVTDRTNFDTPENLLAIACLLKIKNDVEFLLYSKDNEKFDLNFKEQFTLKTLKTQIDNLIAQTQLKQIIPKIIEFSALSIHSRMIKNLEEKTSERIRLGIVRQKSYQDILEWLEKFQGYNVRAITEKFTNFPIDHKKSIDTMYELWIIFEIVTFLVEKKNVQFLSILERGEGKFAGFQLKTNDVVFNLNYQSKKVGWTGQESEPDFNIEIAGREKETIPIVMDPKNWSSSQSGEAIHKMLGYLLNLSQFSAEVGILFFSHPIGRHIQGNVTLPCVPSTQNVNGKLLTFVTMIVNPNDPENLESNLNMFYENLVSVLNKYA